MNSEHYESDTVWENKEVFHVEWQELVTGEEIETSEEPAPPKNKPKTPSKEVETSEKPAPPKNKPKTPPKEVETSEKPAPPKNKPKTPPKNKPKTPPKKKVAADEEGETSEKPKTPPKKDSQSSDGKDQRNWRILTDSETDKAFVKGFFVLPWSSNEILLKAHELSITEHKMRDCEDYSALVKFMKLYVNYDNYFIWLTRCCYSDLILDQTILDLTFDDLATNSASEETQAKKHASSEEPRKVVKKRRCNKRQDN